MRNQVLSRKRAVFASKTATIIAVLQVMCMGGLTGCGPSLNAEFELMQKEQKTGTGLASASGAGAESGAVRLPASVDALTSVATPGNTAYKIGPHDVLDISVFKVPE